MRFARPAILSLWALCTLACVTPHLDGLATAECAHHSDCPTGELCLGGECLPGDPDQGERPPDAADLDHGPPPDAEPDAERDIEGADMPDTLPGDCCIFDMIPDHGWDAAADMAGDGPPDAEVDMAVDADRDGPPPMDLGLDEGPPADQGIDAMVVDAAVDEGADLAPDAAPCIALEETCNGVDDDCDGVVDEAEGAPLCQLPGARLASCREGACAIVRCEVDAVDLDQQPENGCECNIVRAPLPDRPDEEHVDANCDGFDGDLARTLFVSSSRGDFSGTGSPVDPLDNLESALRLINEGAPFEAVALDSADVPGAEPYEVLAPLAVQADVLIYGGYLYSPEQAEPAAKWPRDALLRTPITTAAGVSPAFDVASDASLGLDQVVVSVPDSAEPRAIIGRNCQRIDLHGVEIVIGPAGAGIDGGDGAQGEDAAQPGGVGGGG
ncbi:MAG: hypothetical protein KC620_14800, partial [Myxococcales bacterium]|nr:hypothetical protein [Myxococcales bacterium]